MSRRRIKPEYVILSLVIVALGLAVALRTGNRLRYKLPELLAERAEDITRITVDRASGILQLERREGTWRILPEGYAADGSLVTPMVNALARLELTALVSEAARYARYELDDASRLKVTAYAGARMARQVDVGKQDERGNASFVRLPGDTRIFSSRENLRSLFGKEKAELRDMIVLTAEPGSIVEIVAKRNKESLTLKKVTENSAEQKSITTWKTNAGEPWDQDKVSQLLNAVTRLRAQRFGEQGMTMGKELMNLFLKSQDGNASTLSIHEQADSQYPALSSQNNYPFWLSESQYRDIAAVFEKPAAQ